MLWDSKVIWVELLVGGEKGGYELGDKRRLNVSCSHGRYKVDLVTIQEMLAAALLSRKASQGSGEVCIFLLLKQLRS